MSTALMEWKEENEYKLVSPCDKAGWVLAFFFAIKIAIRSNLVDARSLSISFRSKNAFLFRRPGLPGRLLVCAHQTDCLQLILQIKLHKELSS